MKGLSAVSYEVIPFKVFMIAPKVSTLAAVDGGLTFFLGLGATLIMLIFLEKMGFTINERLVRVVAYGGIGIGFLMLCWKTILLVG
jgi:hypothetical protein